MSSLFFFQVPRAYTHVHSPLHSQRSPPPSQTIFPFKTAKPYSSLSNATQRRLTSLGKALFISKQRRLNTAKASSLQKVCAFSLKVWDYEFLGAKVCPFCLKLWAFVFIFPVLLILIRFDDFLIWTHEFFDDFVLICISAIILLYYCFASLYCFTMLSLKLALNVRRPLKVPSLLTNLLSVLLFDFALQIFNSWTLSVCCYASHCVAFRWRGNWKEKIFVINDALFLC